MATIQVKSAFVEDVLSGERGVWALKTAEPHSRKDEQGNFQTVARTFRTVRASNESGIDLSRFVKGDRITFTGSEKTDVREHQGKKYFDLLVWLDTIDHATGQDRGQDRAGQPQTASADPWSTPTETGAQNAAQGEWDGGGFDDSSTPF